jgi:hypothetical protein
MADARVLLEAVIREAAQLANTGGHLEELQSLALLARTALDAGNGEVPDEVVRASGLHPAVQARLGSD